MRFLLGGFLGALALAQAPAAHAQSAPPTVEAPAPDVDNLERLHRDTIQTRRLLADSVLIGGVASVVGGGVLLVPNGDDQAWRFAGVNTAIFGAVNTIVGLLALHGIAAEESSWESEEARAARRTPEGLTRARIHAALDERRESVSHAINLGLGCAYVGVAGTAVLASQLGVDHPNRWLASGAAIALQALFLVGVDFIGLTRSGSYHRAFVEGLSPSVAVIHTAAGTETHAGLSGRF